MSKNTGTSELINYFDLGVNGDVGIAGSLDINTIANATTDTDKFLVSDTGIIKYRTGAELLSDIGGQVSGNYVTLDTNQTITGEKLFSSLTTFYNASSYTEQARFGGGVNNRYLYTYVDNYGVGLSTGTGFAGESIYFNPVSNYIEFSIASSSKMRLVSGGGLEIGYYSIQNAYKLDVNGTGRFTNTLTPIILRGTNASTMWTEYYYNTSTLSGYVGNGSGLLSGANASDFIVRSEADFVVATGGNNRRLTISSSGNVLINTTTDSGYKLDVNGTGRFSGQLTSGSTTAGFINAKSFLIGTDGTETNYRYQFYLSSNDLKLYSRNYGDFLTINYSTGAATFSSSVTTGATINSGDSITMGGELYYGGITSNRKLRAYSTGSEGSATLNYSFWTGSSWSIVSTLNSGGAATFSSSVTAGSEFISYSGINMDAGGGTIRGGLTINYSTGEFKSFCGISGNTYFQTFNTNGSERMRITSGGNVLIGTTTDTGFKLTVNGSLRNGGASTYWYSGADSGGMYIETVGTTTASRTLRIQGVNDAGNRYSGIYLLAGQEVIKFHTADIERMRITSGGNVLIGTTTDTGAKLNVGGSYQAYPVSIEAMAGGGQLALTRSGAVAEFYMGGSTGGGTQLYVRSGGSGGVRLDAGSTGWVSASDIRLKDVTKPIQKAVESLSGLQTIYYSWKDSIDKSLHIGLIAQEVEKVFPELVSESSIDGMKGVNYTELIPVIIKAIQELNEKINK